MTGILNLLIGASSRPSDPYYEYTTLLLPGNGTNGAQNNTFLDGSTNNFIITRNGNTTQGTFSPFSQTGWANYFNGSTSYLSNASAAVANFGTSDFTFECWLYFTAMESAPYYQVFTTSATAGGFQIYKDTGSTNLVWGVNSVSTNTLYTGTLANQWYHIAVSRSGSTLKTFVNGVQTYSYTNSSNFNITGAYIGAYPTGASYFPGYISNVRIVKGGALYTSNFTPSTTPLTTTVSAGTVSLLTCQSNRFIDNSTNNFTLTVNGSTSVVAFSPFNPTASWSAATYGGSGYFDGSGDYLSVADNANLRFGTSAFTIQAWIYRNASGTAHSIIAKGGASTGYVLQVTSTNVLRFTHGTTNVDTTTTIPASAWTHVAAVRTNTSTNGFQLYINGVSSATATVSTDFNQTDTLYIGSDRSAANVMNGYISGLKYTNGTAETISVPTEPPTATTNVSLLTNFTNAGIYDATSKNDLETVGNAQISTAISAKWGSGSMYFDGTGDYLTATTNAIPATGAFTIEMFVYIVGAGASQCLVSQYLASTSGRWAIYWNDTANKFTWACPTGQTVNSDSTYSINNWIHFVAQRDSSNVFSMYVNGTRNSTTPTESAALYTGVTYVGDRNGGGTPLNGYIQDLRITRGVARYSGSSITVPTAAFPTL